MIFMKKWSLLVALSVLVFSSLFAQSGDRERGKNAKRNEDIAKKYSDTFIGAFGITGEHEQKIRGIIGKLFTEGVAGAKQKKLIITDKSNSIDIELINLGGVSLTKELNVPTTQTFDKYLRGLDDDALVA